MMTLTEDNSHLVYQSALAATSTVRQCVEYLDTLENYVLTQFGRYADIIFLQEGGNLSHFGKMGQTLNARFPNYSIVSLAYAFTRSELIHFFHMGYVKDRIYSQVTSLQHVNVRIRDTVAKVTLENT
jgi:hypothetical protein